MRRSVSGDPLKVISSVMIDGRTLTMPPTATAPTPSPPAAGGEGWGEEGIFIRRFPSPRPSPRSFVAGRGRNRGRLQDAPMIDAPSTKLPRHPIPMLHHPSSRGSAKCFRAAPPPRLTRKTLTPTGKFFPVHPRLFRLRSRIYRRRIQTPNLRTPPRLLTGRK